MLSSYSSKITLEKLPDELLLLICRYLSSSEVLFSFYGLNYRLSQMISGYFQHVVIAQIPYKQFRYICTTILPEIGSNICSLVISNQWKGILSNLFTNYFGEKMFLIFPNLKQLTFVSFTDIKLKLFLDNLKNLSELHEILINHMCQVSTNTNDSEIILHKIFISNNNRLNSVLFDDDSMVFNFQNKINNIFYSNIQKLKIDVKTVDDLHRLLTVLPQLISINVTINEDSTVTDKSDQIDPIFTLKQFHLQSFGPLWNLDDLNSVIKRLPNLEDLSIAIETNDDNRLIDGQIFFSLISTLSLKKFNYFLRYYDLSSSIDYTEILSTWEQFNQEFVCIKCDDKKHLIFYTLPFIFSFLILPSSIAKNEVFRKSYTPQVKNFTICDVTTNIIDTFIVIKKCRRVENLNLRIHEDTLSKFSKEINHCKLPFLNKITTLRESAMNSECFQGLLEISPNLYHLEVNYEFLRPQFDIESVCLLLKHRITHIYILITKTTDLESITSSISRFSSIFPFLKHLYFSLEENNQSADLLILSILNHLSNWNCLVSFGIVNTKLTEEILLKTLPQWILENSTLDDENSFVVDYTDNVFRLWL